MFNKGLLKRMLPFFATFAFGIFVASFFVSIGAPSFKESKRSKCRHELRDLRFEYEQQREEIRRLNEELDGVRINSLTLDSDLPTDMDLDVQLPPPPTIRHKNTAPKTHK